MDKSTERIVIALLGPGGSLIIALGFGIWPAIIFLVAIAIVLAWALAAEKFEPFNCNRGFRDFIKLCKHCRR